MKTILEKDIEEAEKLGLTISKIDESKYWREEYYRVRKLLFIEAVLSLAVIMLLFGLVWGLMAMAMEVC